MADVVVDIHNLQRKVLSWIGKNSPGGVGETMSFWLAFMVRRPRGIAHPDSRRDMAECVSLLESVPELARELPRMAELSPEWRAAVKHWSILSYAEPEDIRRIIRQEVEQEVDLEVEQDKRTA